MPADKPETFPPQDKARLQRHRDMERHGVRESDTNPCVLCIFCVWLCCVCAFGWVGDVFFSLYFPFCFCVCVKERTRTKSAKAKARGVFFGWAFGFLASHPRFWRLWLFASSAFPVPLRALWLWFLASRIISITSSSLFESSLLRTSWGGRPPPPTHPLLFSLFAE